MVEISEEIKNKIKNEQNIDSAFRTKIQSKISQDNPTTSAREIRLATKRVFREMSSDTSEQNVQHQEDDLNRRLQRYFTYDGDSLELEQFKTADWDEIRFTRSALSGRFANAMNQLFNDLINYARDDPTFSRNILDLKQRYDELIERKAKGVTRKFIKLGWAKEVGNMTLSDYDVRDKLYSYWEDKHKKFEPTKAAIEKFIDEVEEQADAIKSKMDSDEDLQEVEEYFSIVKEMKESLPDLKNYVLLLEPFQTTTSITEVKAFYLLSKFVEMQGAGKKEKVEAHIIEESQSADPKGVLSDVGRTRVSVEDLMRRANFSNSKNLLLDPILWYENNKDFDSINVTEAEYKRLEKRVSVLGKKMYHDMPDYLNSFMAWFKLFEGEVSHAKDGGFYLPMSQFIHDYGKRSTDAITKDGLTVDDVRNIDEDTLDFLELVAKLTDSADDAFTLRQKQIGQKGSKEKLKDYFITHVKTTRGREQPAIKGKLRLRPSEFDKAFSKMIRAINNYYLIPSQSKYYVQQNERPRWVKNKSAWDLAIQSSNMNPLGALISNVTSYALSGITAKDITGLNNFIDNVRRGGYKSFSTAVRRDAKTAVKALNKMFGKKYDKKNIISIGYIIYDMLKDLEHTVGEDTVSIGTFMQQPTEMFMGQPLTKLYKQYIGVTGKHAIFPIDMLRQGLETPELLAWIGESSGRSKSESGAFQYLDPKVASEFLRLKNTLDTFHYMDYVNVSLLEAHDTIRKMNGESIVKGYMVLDDITHMDDIITTVHDNYGADLTAMEINKIVTSVSSYDSLSKNHGITSEAVYTIKSMFR